MNKLIKYLLFIYFCLIGFVGVTKAYDLNPGGEMVLMEFDEGHKNPKCEVSKGNLASSPYTMVPASGETTAGRSIALKFDKQISGHGEIVIDCNYKTFDNEEKKQTYWFEYGIAETGNTADMFVILDTIDNRPFDLGREAGMDSVVSLDIEDPNGMIKKNCSGSKCEISVSESFEKIGQFRAYATFKYKKTVSGTQVTYTAKVIIDVYANNGATLDITKTNLGTCGTPNSSDWISAEDDPDIYNPGNDMLYFSTRLGTLSFPNCEVKTSANPLLEFKGWVGQKRGAAHASESVSIQGVGSCSRYNPQKGSFVAEAGKIYFPCYDYGKGIIIFGNGKKLDIDNTWNPYTTTNSYYKMSEDKIQLPDAILEGEYSQNQSIKGWKNKRTGEVVPAGTYVEPDGSIYILVTQTEITNRNYYKSIFANEAYKLSPSDGKVTGCESADTSFITNVGNGECILMGHKSTGNEYIDVTVFGENGYQRVFHVRVESRSGYSESGDEAFIINVTPNIVASLSDSGTLTNYFIETCDSFKLQATSEVGTDPSGTNILAYKYVPDGCNYNGNYLSYCIDAGRTGPLPENGIEYVKSESIDMNSDFGKLITYMGRMGMFTENSQDVLDVTTLVRIVGIINNLTVASEYNSQDTAHAGSYQYYKTIAEQIVGAGGKIDPEKVDQVSSLNARVKTVLKEYQKVEDYTGSNFERTIDNIIYSEIDASGNYTVSYEGLMIIPGDEAELHPPEAINGTVDKFELAPDERVVDGRTTYEYKVTISGNVNTMTLPTTGTNGNAVTDQAKKYCFRLRIKSGGEARDVFITEPSGRAAGDGYQRMISINQSEPNIYVYFSPAPSVKACGGLAALDPSNPNLNASLFRATGCCNMPALDQELLDEVCTNKCISTNIGSVCEYRDNFDINNPIADFYEINEGKKGEDYKIGSGENSECIVKTDDMGWNRSEGMLLHDSSVNKFDDAGNSLMVDSYKNNRYCRVSCSENWQLSMEAFGNFVGDRAIAAGSYFAVNDTDMFVSGKRTCYTTFINYGNTNERTEVGAGDEGFTKDLSDESDNIANMYNRYSNLSHVYADLACENDGEYHTTGGHDVKCSYSNVFAFGMKFCTSIRQRSYCLIGPLDEYAGGDCTFSVKAYEELYCPSGYSMSSDETSCTTTFSKTDTSHFDHSKTKDYKADGTCPDDYKEDNYPNSTSPAKCYKWVKSSECQDNGDGETGTTTPSGGSCSKTIGVKHYYHCKYKRDGTAVPDDWLPNKALRTAMADEPFGFEYDGPALAGAERVPDVDYKNEDGSADGTMCYYKHPPLHFNQCTSTGYAACIHYAISTTNKVDDGDEADDGHGGMTPTEPGEYVRYDLDSGDNLLNPETHPKGETEDYDSIHSYSGTSGSGGGLSTGRFESSAFEGYAYALEAQARMELANDQGSSSTNYRSYRIVNDNSDDATPSLNANVYTKFRYVSDPATFCVSESGGSVTREGLSWSPAATSVADKGTLSSTGGPAVLTGMTYTEACSTDYPNCWYKQGDGGNLVAYIYGNQTPPEFKGLPMSHGEYDNYTDNQSNAPKGDPGGGCDEGDNCDTARAKAVRRAMLDGTKFKPTLTGFAQSMIASNSRIITYSKDMYACQHFELYNASDGENNERKNNTLWASNFMGTRRSFTRIVSSFEPQISYSYDEAEYMTLLNNDNVMERFNDLNDQTYGCYKILTNSGEHGCYNNSTNKRVETTVKRYKDGEQVGSEQNVFLARNYTENYYYDRQNKDWANDSQEAKSYGEAGIGDGTVETMLTCNGDDCNIGDQLDDINMYKRTLLCSIGLVNDEPILSSHSDGKSSSLTSVYVNDKDFFWTGGTCFINQVQYIRANYIKGSIENSSFYKNKGFWYVNNSNDAKAHGDNLINALENSNDILKATYNTRDENELGAWSVEGGYNVFPIKLNTPRDLYTYRYQFAEIGSYGDGKLGRVMGTDQSLVAINERVCFYEVFEELCLCCGNPINAHTMSDAPYEFVNSTASEYAMSYTDNTLVPSATIAINTSNISLSDMQSDSNRDLGDNWGEQSLFFYDGNDFYTNKGAELLKEIQAEGRGENIYSETPEYRFVINPQGMSEIRKYNDDHRYGINYKYTTSTGRYAIMPFDGETYLSCTNLSNCEWEIPGTTDEDNYPQNRIINFTHFKSKFLEEELKEPKYANKVNFTGRYSDYGIGMHPDCYVTSNDVSTMHTKAESCRWVDYLQPMEHTDVDGNTNTYYYRLAYK